MRRTAILLLTAALLVLAAVPGDGQTPPAAPAVLVVDASAALVDALIYRKIDRTEPFEDVIKDIPNTGTRRTVGSVHGVLVPDATHGAVDIVFQGTTVARAVGRRTLTRTCTNSVTAVTSTYRVTFDARGLWGMRAGANAGAAITLLDAVDIWGDRDSTPANLVRLGFPGEKDELEGIVSRRAARQAALEQQAEVSATLANAGKTLGLASAKGLGLNVAALQFETTATVLQTRLPSTGSSRAVALPPPLPAADLSVRLHQSFLDDVARAGLGGRTFQLGALQRQSQDLLGRLLRDARPQKERTAAVQALEKVLRSLTGKTVTLTAATDDPLRFTFAGERVIAVAHIAALQLGDRVVPGVRLKAVYRIVNRREGIALEREGPLTVVPDQPLFKGESVLETAVQTMIGLLGSEIFVRRFDAVNLARPENVVPVRADSANGWLSVSWKMRR